MKTFLLIILLTSLIMLLNCSDDAMGTKLPPITMTGENTFGMLVADEAWEPSTPGILVPSADTKGAFYNPASGNVQIFAQNKSQQNHQEIEFFIEEVRNVGDYSWAAINPRFAQVLCDDSTRFDPNTNNASACVEAFTLTNETYGTVTISALDTVNKIISGTFDAQLRNRDSQPLVITEGRFDLIYQ